MGLNLAPAYRVIANRDDITAIIAARLVSLTVTDEAGVASDSVAITLADHDPDNAIGLPATGAELQIAIGYDDAARYMGLFVVDTVELTGPPRQMRIAAKASPHGPTPTGITALQTQLSRSWPAGTTIGAMVEAIAHDHALTPAVSEALAAIGLPHIDQTNESDINLLTRVARDHDAVAKPGDGRLAMVPADAGQSASGQSLPAIAISAEQITTWRMRQTTKPPAARVIATYRDHAGGQDRDVVVGDGEPVQRLAHTYASQSSAARAARAARQRSQRAGRHINLTLPGNPDLRAEGHIQVSGLRDGVDGAWVIKHVEHRLGGGGYTATVSGDPVSAQ